jgi:hypothetical protein
MDEIREGNLKGRDHSGDLRGDGRLTLRRILNKQSVGAYTGFIWFTTGSNGGIF